MTARRADRGSASVEMAILAPALLALLALAIVGGRVALAGGSVDGAARDAARSASISRTPAAAQRAAHASAASSLSQQGIQCRSLSVQVNTAGLTRRAGTRATVSATVTCIVRLSDVAVAGIPGSRTMRASFTSPVDPFRSAR